MLVSVLTKINYFILFFIYFTITYIHINMVCAYFHCVCNNYMIVIMIRFFLEKYFIEIKMKNTIVYIKFIFISK